MQLIQKIFFSNHNIRVLKNVFYVSIYISKLGGIGILKNSLPIIVARGIVVLPFTDVNMEIGRPSSIAALEDALNNKNKQLIIVAQKNPDIEKPAYKDLFDVGTLVKIKKAVKDENTGDYSIVVTGLESIEIIKPENEDEAVSTSIEYNVLKVESTIDEETLKTINETFQLVESSNVYFDPKYAKVVKKELANEDINYLKAINNCTMGLSIDNEERLQESLETLSLQGKVRVISDIVFSQTGNVDNAKEVDDIINNKLNSNLNKQQKEFYLRERLRIIKEELGEITNRDDETEKIKRRLEQYPYPKHIKEKVRSELSKFEMSGNSNEASIIKAYIDWLMDLPWWQETEDNINLANVQETLDKNHFGIEKVKQRIIEYLALKMQNPKAKGPIICLVGPPGVGKTSLARSIAEALGKVYVKVSLGGVRDESEIRGHRRTYLGAMPGRIIKGMKKAGVTNPLFLLDEIDKMSSDQRGDPASAMLEVLDPEQNARFSDNYIEEEYNLSNVMFLATANYYNQIPHALIDRLEVIELSSYTANEKKEIAKNHLISRVLDASNLTNDDITITDEALDHIINYYTREAGVRELERVIQQIVRKYLVEKLKAKNKKLTKVVTPEVIEEYLGKKKFDVTLKEKETIPGIVNGMAYTAAGGDLLPIEATYFKGKGNVVITGNLEQTMKESVSVALGYVKSNAKHFGINEDVFKDIDLHIHVPAGGIPKDGPSAGVTLTTAIISVLTNIPVKTTISMTGEIMLRGKVGIIGGVKEKTISAYRAGVREIFMPKDDERFLDDVPTEIKKDLNIHLVEKYQEIYDVIFKGVKPIARTEANKDLYDSFENK